MLDKGHATQAGTDGEFVCDSPTDQRIINFLGIDTAVLWEKLATGKGGRVSS